MLRVSSSLLAGLAFASALTAQGNPTVPELSVNNTFRVISSTKHPITNNPYPAASTLPPGYTAAPGVAAGTRAWSYTPKLRAQAGANPPNYLTVVGMTQAVFTGSAVQSFPAPNHYQFRTGIGVTQPGQNSYHRTHATTGQDLLNVADQPLVISTWAIVEHSFNLTTPVPLPDLELLLFVEYRGGEWRDDPNGGQTVASDWRGGRGPGGWPYHGWAVGSNPRTITLGGDWNYRPKIGLLVNELVLTATGDHANAYEVPRLANETYRGNTACISDWSRASNGNLFFDVRAGNNWGSTGIAVVFINMGRSWFAGSLPTPFGNLLLDPTFPALDVLASITMPLSAGGTFSGANAQIPVPPLGFAARGEILKCQGLVFNAGFTSVTLTTASSILVE
ncbi:MAG: hypothetical protein IT458_15100 [Planctomycetes bacterium]|nr:hypothetical protein [Planctomycetota bacterium]